MNKTLNFRYLFRFVVIVAIVGGAVHFTHARQASKQAQAFLHQAGEAQKKGDLARTITYLSRYLVFERGDSDARARMGFAMARIARKPDERLEAFLVLEQVLRDDPKRDDVRLKNVRVAMDPTLQLFDDALAHLEILRRVQPNHAELLDLTGQCLAVKGDYVNANGMFAEAIRQKPDSLQTYARQAGLLRLNLKDADQAVEKADAVIDELVARNPETAHAHLIAAAYWNVFGAEAKADAAIAKALRYGEHDAEVLLKAAEFAVNRAERFRQTFKADDSKKEIDNARRLLRLGIDKNAAPVVDAAAPEEEQDSVASKRAILAELYRNLVSLEVRMDQLADAETKARQGAELLAEQPELVLSLVDVLIRRDKIDEAADNLKKLQDAGYPQAVLDYHHARILTRGNQWLAASHALARAVPDLVVFPAFARQANFLLGECYDRMGEVDLRYDAFKNAVPSDVFDPLWIPASVALAASQAEMGRIKEAIATYRSVARFAPGAIVPLARLLLMETLRQPPDKRDWSEVDGLLIIAGEGVDAAPIIGLVVGHGERLKIASESLDAALLRGDVLAVRGRIADARRTLDLAKEKYADRVDLWVAYALLAFVQKDGAGAEKLLKDAETKFGDRVEIRLARARFLPAPATPESTRRLAELAGAADKLSVADRGRLLHGISEIARSLGANELAAELWERLTIDVPDNLAVHYKRFDRAIQIDDEAAMLQVQKDIERIDGKGGTSTRMARSLYLIWRARKKDDKSGLTEAKNHLVELEAKRPGWSRIPLGLAVVYDLLGDGDSLDAAMRKYQQAVDLGEKDPEVVSRLIQLYYARQRFTEADVLLRDFSDAVANKESLQFIATEVALETNHFVRALESAEKAVTQDTKDYQKQLWLGRVRGMCGKKVEAEAPFRKAVELAGDKPETWIALIQYLANMERKADAEKLFDEARLRIKKEDAALTLAQGYEILERTKEAQEWYEKALAERPDDVPVLRAVANFRLRQARTDSDLVPVQVMLEHILQLKSKTADDADFARRLLAITLAISPDYQKSRRALEILGILEESLSTPTAAMTVEEKRTRAVVLALQHGRKPRLEAVRLLEEIDARKPLSPDDRFLLAQLYNLVGERQKAQSRLAKLAVTHRANPLYLSSYIRFLILEGDRGDLFEAQKCFKDFEKSQPDVMATAELRARLLVADKKNREAADGLLAYVKKKKEMALSAARLLEGFKDYAPAEALLKQVIEDSKKPAARLILAEFYARQNRNDDALKVLELNAAEYPPSLAIVALGVLYTIDRPRPEDIRRVRALIQKHAPKGSDLLMEEAALFNLEGDYAKAATNYERIIARDPKNVLAINNYAFLLACHDNKLAEALDWIRKAKAQTKPEPVLFDTEAIILIRSGNPDAAIELLLDAVIDAPTASSFFHLAQAHLQNGKRIDAAAALAKARKLGLRPSDLHPLEQEAYKNLLKEFN